MKRWLKRKKYKYQLEEVFKKAKLYDEHITRGGKVPIYPTIHDVYEGKESVRYTFTLPNGVDPTQIHKKWFCFQQILGENLMMEGNIKSSYSMYFILMQVYSLTITVINNGSHY